MSKFYGPAPRRKSVLACYRCDFLVRDEKDFRCQCPRACHGVSLAGTNMGRLITTENDGVAPETPEWCPYLQEKKP